MRLYLEHPSYHIVMLIFLMSFISLFPFYGVPSLPYAFSISAHLPVSWFDRSVLRKWEVI